MKRIICLSIVVGISAAATAAPVPSQTPPPGPGSEWTLRVEHGAAYVSVVGLGLGAREAARAEAALERAGVALIALRVSPTALIFRVPNERVEDAARALHAGLVE